MIPSSPILIEQEYRLSRRSDTRAQTRRLNLHQRHQTMHFRFFRIELGQNATKAKRVLAKRRPHDIVTCSGRIALVEDQINDFEYRRQSRGKFGAARDLERYVRVSECPLRADDTLRDRRLGNEKSACDLVSRQAAEETKGERSARFARQNRVTGHEDQAEHVVANVVVERGVELRHGSLLSFP